MKIGRRAGPPQARPAPSGGSEPHAVGSVGAYVLIAGNGDSIFKRLMLCIGRADLARDPGWADNTGRVDRVAGPDEETDQGAQRSTGSQVPAQLGGFRIAVTAVPAK